MPFISQIAQMIRLTPSPGGSNTVTATTNGSAQFNNLIDTATCQNLPGMVGWYKDSQGQVSVLAYSQAQASIPYGAALMHAAGNLVTATGVASTRVRSGYDCNVVAALTTAYGAYSGNFAGVAGASIINTGVYFWRYISGFVPEALVATGMASGTLLAPCATTANVLGTVNNLNAATVAATAAQSVGFMVGIGPANGGLASVYLTGWYM